MARCTRCPRWFKSQYAMTKHQEATNSNCFRDYTRWKQSRKKIKPKALLLGLQPYSCRLDPGAAALPSQEVFQDAMEVVEEHTASDAEMDNELRINLVDAKHMREYAVWRNEANAVVPGAAVESDEAEYINVHMQRNGLQERGAQDPWKERIRKRYPHKMIKIYETATEVVGQQKTFIDDFLCDTHAEERKTNLWYPFATLEEWELTNFLANSGLSLASLNTLLNLSMVSGQRRQTMRH